MTQSQIVYSGFYDFPLAFATSHEGRRYLFLRGWDEALDDYETDFQVYLLPDMTDEMIQASWGTLTDVAGESIGTIAVRAIPFDPSHRKWIDSTAFLLIRLRE